MGTKRGWNRRKRDDEWSTLSNPHAMAEAGHRKE
jgi:hypothetical protein